MSTNLRKNLIAIALVTAAPTSLATTIENASFETGDLTGWSTTGGAQATMSYQGAFSATVYTAPWEDYFATVTASCSTNTLMQTFSAKEGEVLLGWSFFKANDYIPFNDTGVVKLVVESDNTQTILFQSSVSEVGDYGGTNWVPWEFVAPEDGDFTIKVESTDILDCLLSSTVGIDLAETGSGLVTGGGWINSPVGAYMADETLSGKATFGFVSKYKKGAVKPTGNTEFQFQVADVNFHSSDYTWLVVNQAGHNAQYKGVGTINGEGNYGFMLWGGDYSNSPDTFRIKIWDQDNADVVVYDNGVSQALGGGNIMIKTK